MLEIRPDGGATLEDEDFRIEVQGERLDLVGGEARQKRLYRATERRLTLRCQPAASGYPERIADPDNPMQTLVFARARGGS